MTGRLGSWAIYANLPQAVYVCDKTEATVVVVNICNRNNVPALIRIAVSASSTSPANADYIEYDVELGPKGVLERTGVTVSPGQYIVVQSSIDAVSAVCWGPTIGDEYPVTPISTAPKWSTDTNLTVYAGYTSDLQLKAVDPKGASEISYSLGSGSTLPPDTTLTSAGLITGLVSTAGYTTSGVTTSITVNATDGTAITPKTFSIIRRWQDGLSEANAAPSAQYIKTLTGTTTNGDYWIKPTGQAAYQIYCDMTSQSGGWMLVGVGRNGRADNVVTRDWWRDDGDTSLAFSTGLKQTNLSGLANYNPRYMPVGWIKAAAGNTWAELEMIVNRIELADSLYFRGGTAQFSWSAFETVPATLSLNYSYWTGTWLTGSNTYNYNNFQWTDTLNNGSPVVNDQNRSFTWSWGGHDGNTGWSAGSSVTGNGAIPGPDAGFVNSNEGHALQMVNIFVR